MDDLYRQIFKYINHRNSTFPTIFYTDRYFLIDKKEWKRLKYFNTVNSESDIIYLYKIDDLHTIVHSPLSVFNETKKKYNIYNFKRYLNHLYKGTKVCKYIDPKVIQMNLFIKNIKRVSNNHVNTVMTFFNYFKFNIPLFNALLLNMILYHHGLVTSCILKLPKKKKILFEQILEYNDSLLKDK